MPSHAPTVRLGRAALVLSSLCLATAASAHWGPADPWHPHGAGYPHGGGPGYGMGQGMGPGSMHGDSSGFMRGPLIDADGDGAVSVDEASALHETMFDAMDADADGDLVREEYLAGRPPAGAGRGDGPGVRAREARFDEQDADGDERLSRSEFMASARTRYEAADANEDGRVDVWEFRSQRPGWR